MRTRETITISLPPGILRQIKRVQKAEQRTSSELVREALRHYFARRFEEVEPTKRELYLIRRGRAAVKRGDYITLEEFLSRYGVERPPRKAKRARKRA